MKVKLGDLEDNLRRFSMHIQSSNEISDRKENMERQNMEGQLQMR